VQVLPTLELLGQSVRQEGLPFELAARHSLPLPSLFSLAFPRPALPGGALAGPAAKESMPWLLSVYAGLVVSWLATLALTGRRRRWTLFWSATALLGVLLALGSHSPVYRLAFDTLPGFRSIRYPEKFLLLTAFALPALAAAGLERLLAGGISRRALAPGAALAAASGAGSLIWMREAMRPPAAEALAHAVPVFAATGALLLLAASRRAAARQTGAALCALAAFDLALPARAVNPSVPWSFYARPWVASVLERRAEDPRTYRIRSTPLASDMEQVAVVTRARLLSNHYLFQQSLAPNLGEMFGYLQHDGMSGIETRATADQIDALVAADPARGMRLLRLMGVRYVATSLPLPPREVTRVATHPEIPVSVMRLRAPLSRAYLVGRWERRPDARSGLGRALEPDFPLAESVVLDRVPGTVQPDPSWTWGSLRARWGASRLTFEVAVPRASVLVVTDSHYPGWRATLDGAPVPILLANGFGRAVAIPPGRHRVIFRYRPRSFEVGAVLSGAMLVSMATLAFGRRRTAGVTLASCARAPAVHPAASPGSPAGRHEQAPELEGAA
nr:YfhO family protein [Gemmatimonadota bacterium]